MRFYQWLKEEIILAIPSIIYFAIAFNLVIFTVGLSLKPYDARYYSYFAATIGALFVGKVIIITNKLPYINAFPNKPLAYNILWKFLIYSISVFIFRALDRFLFLMDKHTKISVVYHRLKSALVSDIFWSTQMWLFLVFFIFVVFSEFERVIGRKEIMRMLFG